MFVLDELVVTWALRGSTHPTLMSSCITNVSRYAEDAILTLQVCNFLLIEESGESRGLVAIDVRARAGIEVGDGPEGKGSSIRSHVSRILDLRIDGPHDGRRVVGYLKAIWSICTHRTATTGRPRVRLSARLGSGNITWVCRAVLVEGNSVDGWVPGLDRVVTWHNRAQEIRRSSSLEIARDFDIVSEYRGGVPTDGVPEVRLVRLDLYQEKESQISFMSMVRTGEKTMEEDVYPKTPAVQGTGRSLHEETDKGKIQNSCSWCMGRRGHCHHCIESFSYGIYRTVSP